MLRTPVTTPQLVIEDDFATIDPVAPQPGPQEPAVPGLHRMQSRTGLTHVTGMKAGSRVPERLLDLKYQLVFLEAHAEDSSGGVHKTKKKDQATKAKEAAAKKKVEERSGEKAPEGLP